VNFFGHAAIASWSHTAPGVALGAMVPDFATMCRAKVPTSADAAITDGIALHHRTDAAFHHLPVVTGLMRELDDRLARGGCARGPRRAVAHVGMELPHDGELTWTDGGTRFAVLLGRLRAYGVPDDLQRPEAIAQRLARILAGRPLIEPSASDLHAIRTALAEHAPRVAVAAETVMRGMRAALG